MHFYGTTLDLIRNKLVARSKWKAAQGRAGGPTKERRSGRCRRQQCVKSISSKLVTRTQTYRCVRVRTLMRVGIPRVGVVVAKEKWRKTALIILPSAWIMMHSRVLALKPFKKNLPVSCCWIAIPQQYLASKQLLLVINDTRLPVPPGPPPDAPRCPQCPISGGSLLQPDDASVTVAGSFRRPLRSRLRVLRLRSSSEAVDDTAAARFT